MCSFYASFCADFWWLGVAVCAAVWWRFGASFVQFGDVFWSCVLCSLMLIFGSLMQQVGADFWWFDVVV